MPKPKFHPGHPGRPRRGSVTLVVMWTIAIAALIVSAVQLLGYRQAMLGREALGRVQARWAARAGIEQTIAVMALHTETPVPDDAFALIREMEYVSADYLDAGGRTIAGWDIRHHASSGRCL